jgi:UMF1 family MFS transporter
MGRLSGIAWGLGYLGGLFCLAAALFLLVGLGSIKPLIALPQDTYAHIRATGPLVALWFAVFALPFFLFTQDNERTGRGMFEAMALGWRQLRETLGALRRHNNLARILIASAIYRDGLNTLFSGGVIYAGGSSG